ncbi:MAG: M14 family metallopeptidase [Bacteroidetes bacterium]|nr:M14 family metallopeptidase [Bacteroidota bacterium]
MFRSTACATLCAVTLLLSVASGQTQEIPFYPNGTYQTNIPSPDQVLGFPLGTRPARYDEVVRYLHALSASTKRVALIDMGRTYEQRTQYLLLISDEENLKRAEEHRASIGKLFDPRKTDAATAAAIIKATPAVVWIGYGIHGDEISSVDACMQVAYQLAAGTDAATELLRKNLIILLEPMENPDGRERFLAQMQQWGSTVPNPDMQTISHQGTWPGGRSNHYLFDLNRDWFSQVHVESRNRMPHITAWHPQLVIDSHEMGGYDTYVFTPPREPVNHNIPPFARKWWGRFATNHGAAFDKYGWSYYTREWVDEWYPGYGSSWPLYTDAVGILYEQAGTDGSPVKRPDGTTLTYREAVHHHFVSSIADLSTAAHNREEFLRDYADAKRKTLEIPKNSPRAFYFDPGTNPSRVKRLVQTLLYQKIEVRITDKPFRLNDAVNSWTGKQASIMLPQGTYVVPLDQPMGRLARTILEFDPRMPTQLLQEERKALEKEKDSKMYDVTAWSLPIAYGVDAYTSTAPLPASSDVASLPSTAGSVLAPDASYGFLMSFDDDASIDALSALMAAGYVARSGKEEVTVGGIQFHRGSILLRKHENPASLVSALQTITKSTGVTFHGVSSALTQKGPDLGGNDFVLLKEPRIALITGTEIGTGSFGALWHLLDYRLKMRFSILQTSQLASADLDKYTVLVLPSARSSEVFGRTLGRTTVTRINEWMSRGGTLIAIGNAAAYAADTGSGLASTRLLHQVLKDRELYLKAAGMERAALSPVVDSVALWGGSMPSAKPAKEEKNAKPDDKEMKLYDDRGRLFMPRGTIMRTQLDDEHWIAFGVGQEVGAYFFSSNAFVSKDPVQTPARFSEAADLRISGLLWPEARERWASTAYATREAKGRGQIILFAEEPNFRGFFHGTERLLLNAIFLGPGFGTASQAQW